MIDSQFLTICNLLSQVLTINYQILSCMVRQDTDLVSQWKEYILDLNKEISGWADELQNFQSSSSEQ